MKTNNDKSPNYSIQSVVSSIDILFELSEHDEGLGVTELSEKMNSSKNYVFRILWSLKEGGLVKQNLESKKYCLNKGAVLKLTSVLNSFKIVQKRAQPILLKLAERTGETVCLGVASEEKVFYLDSVESKHPVRLMSRSSMSLPLHSTAIGKVYLAEKNEDHLIQLLKTSPLDRFTANTISSPTQLVSDLRQIREQGFAIEDQEMYPDVWVVAAPVLDYKGQFVAAISIEMPACRVESVDLQSFMANLVMEAGWALSSELGFDQALQHNDDISEQAM